MPAHSTAAAAPVRAALLRAQRQQRVDARGPERGQQAAGGGGDETEPRGRGWVKRGAVSLSSTCDSRRTREIGWSGSTRRTILEIAGASDIGSRPASVRTTSSFGV